MIQKGNDLFGSLYFYLNFLTIILLLKWLAERNYEMDDWPDKYREDHNEQEIL